MEEFTPGLTQAEKAEQHQEYRNRNDEAATNLTEILVDGHVLSAIF